MKTTVLLKLSASAVIVATVTVGCTSAGTRPAALSSSAAPAERDGAGSVSIAAAETAVAAAPRDAASRASLGQAYMLAGRFASARSSFRDALALDSTLDKAALNLALTEVAMGNGNAALQMLDELDGKVAAGDRGLAYALAGEPHRAVMILEAAARAKSADARVRQNLALSYALAGRWNEAKSTAAQDLSPDQVGRRMLEWVLLTRPSTSWEQVAGVLGVKPGYDPGQPVALALAPLPESAAAPVALAVAEPAPIAQETTPPAFANVAPPAVELADAATPVIDQTPAPQAVPVLLQAAAVTSPAALPPLISAPRTPIKLMVLASAPARAVRAPAPQARGGFVVQLGAYSSAARVETAWNRIATRVAMVMDYAPSSGTLALQQVGTVYRLSLAGFATRDAATTVCERVRAKGGECFVRAAIDDRPVQWTARKIKGEQFAAR